MKLTKTLKILLMLVLSLAILTSCNLNKKNDTPSITITPEIKEAYNKAISSIITLDDSTKVVLNNAYNDQRGENLSVNEYTAKLGELITGSFCYGNYENCIIVFRPTDPNVKMTKIIAGIEFDFAGSFALDAYCDGQFYKLDIAYHNGYVTRDQIIAAAEIHDNILQYNKLINEASK